MPLGIVEIALVYVPLSLVQRLKDLVILQHFSVNTFQVKPSKRQTADRDRIAVIYEQTRRRYPQYFVQFDIAYTYIIVSVSDQLIFFSTILRVMIEGWAW